MLDRTFDVLSYVMGSNASSRSVVIDGTIICTDDGEGNVTIETGDDDA